MSSLSGRIKLFVLLFYSSSIVIMLLMAWYLLEELEEATLEIDKQTEIEHFLNRQQTDEVTHIQSALLTLTYLPAGTSTTENLPVIFNGLPIPFEDEVEFLGTEYTVIINQLAEGTYYFAKNLSLFEEHEERMMQTLYTLGITALLLGLGFVYLISRRITRPIQSLTRDIQNVVQGKKETYLPKTYKDDELFNIAESFNSYLNEIDQLIDRERSMITMASHELRTPVAVILGAAEILEKRQNLNADDKKTLGRISDAASIMSSNIRVLLGLVQQKKDKESWTRFSLLEMSSELIAYIDASDPASAERVKVAQTSDVFITSNREMVRMLLENLVMNSLKHNQGLVTISFNEEFLEVRDQGIKTVAGTSTVLTEAASSSGLGLYITNLICAELGWKFSLEISPDSESSARSYFNSPAIG